MYIDGRKDNLNKTLHIMTIKLSPKNQNRSFLQILHINEENVENLRKLKQTFRKNHYLVSSLKEIKISYVDKIL